MSQYHPNPSFRQCTEYATIHSLPIELLGSIFTIANPPHELCAMKTLGELGQRQRKKSKPICLDRIVGVCQKWRKVAIGMPVLWSHVDIVASGTSANWKSQKMHLQLVRVGSIPLELHVNSSLDFYYDPKLIVSDFQKSIGFLSQFKIRCHSLYLTFSSDTPDIPHLMLEFLTRCNSFGVLHTLAFTEEDGDNVFKNDFLLGYCEKSTVRRLALDGLFLPPSIVVCSNLVELSVDLRLGDVQATTRDISAVLSACLGLRRLELIGLEFADSELMAGDAVPIVLKELEEINLQGLEYPIVSTMLSLISFGAKPLCASVCVDLSVDDEEVIPLFFRGAKVTSLFIESQRNPGCAWVERLPKRLLHLEQLCFHDAYLDDNIIDVISALPRLHTLYLSHCTVSFPCLSGLLELNKLRILGLWSCGPDEEKDTDPRAKISAELCQNVPKFTVNKGECPALDWPWVKPLTSQWLGFSLE